VFCITHMFPLAGSRTLVGLADRRGADLVLVLNLGTLRLFGRAEAPSSHKMLCLAATHVGRVTRIEPALSAWELDRSCPLIPLTR
jgi:hypothetical protein